jgi:ABC-type transporter Mla subunit MlaD
MSKVHKIRQAIDVNLDMWEAWASAIGDQLNLTSEQALKKLEQKEKQVLNLLDQLEQILKESSSIAEAKKAGVLIAIDHLKIQLAVNVFKGEAIARSAYDEHKNNIEDAISSLETKIDQNLDIIDDSIDKSLSNFIKGANELDAVLEAIDSRFDEQVAQLSEMQEAKKKELESQIAEYKKELKTGREQAEANWETFSDEFSKGHKQILGAFKNLFS